MNHGVITLWIKREDQGPNGKWGILEYFNWDANYRRRSKWRQAQIEAARHRIAGWCKTYPRFVNAAFALEEQVHSDEPPVHIFGSPRENRLTHWGNSNPQSQFAFGMYIQKPGGHTRHLPNLNKKKEERRYIVPSPVRYWPERPKPGGYRRKLTKAFKAKKKAERNVARLQKIAWVLEAVFGPFQQLEKGKVACQEKRRRQASKDTSSQTRLEGRRKKQKPFVKKKPNKRKPNKSNGKKKVGSIARTAASPSPQCGQSVSKRKGGKSCITSIRKPAPSRGKLPIRKTSTKRRGSSTKASRRKPITRLRSASRSKSRAKAHSKKKGRVKK